MRDRDRESTSLHVFYFFGDVVKFVSSEVREIENLLHANIVDIVMFWDVYSASGIKL